MTEPLIGAGRPQGPLSKEQVVAAQVEFAKLNHVGRLVRTIEQVNQPALTELLYRLEQSFKGRIISDARDTATPQEMAQALLVAVLMAGITVEVPPEAQLNLKPGQFAVLDMRDHSVIKSFASEDEARAFLAEMADVTSVMVEGETVEEAFDRIPRVTVEEIEEVLQPDLPMSMLDECLAKKPG